MIKKKEKTKKEKQRKRGEKREKQKKGKKKKRNPTNWAHVSCLEMATSFQSLMNYPDIQNWFRVTRRVIVIQLFSCISLGPCCISAQWQVTRQPHSHPGQIVASHWIELDVPIPAFWETIERNWSQQLERWIITDLPRGTNHISYCKMVTEINTWKSSGFVSAF